MDELLEILSDINPTIDYATEKHLMTDKRLNSLNILALITEICDAFDIEISPKWIRSENFESVEAMWSMIEAIQDEQ